MKIVNRTRGTIVATNARRARGYLGRMMGLMFQRTLPDGGGLLLEPEHSIHTFFMRFPIDVLYLGDSGSVRRADPEVAPFRIGPLFTPGCRAVLELPAGTIVATGTRVGDRVEIVEGD